MLQFCLKYPKCCSLASEVQYMLSEAKGRKSPARHYKAHNWDSSWPCVPSPFEAQNLRRHPAPCLICCATAFPLPQYEFGPFSKPGKRRYTYKTGLVMPVLHHSDDSYMKGITTVGIPGLPGTLLRCFSGYSCLLRNLLILQSYVQGKVWEYLYQ